MSSAHRYTWERADGSKGKAWRAKWIGPDGKTHRKRGFERKGDAEAWARARELEAQTGLVLGERQPDGVTLGAWSATWFEGLDVRPTSEASYAAAVARVLPSLGDRPVAAIRPSEIKTLRRSLSTRYAPNTVDQTLAVLGMVLRAAVHDGLVDRTPMPPQSGGGAGRVVDPDELLTLEQVRAWGRAMPLVGREMPVFAAATGLRQGELLGLRLTGVDFLRRQVRVSDQMVTPLGRGVPQYGPTKTPAGVRTVPLPAVAAEAIARHLERFPAVEGEPIFRGQRFGQRWRRQSFRDMWAPAALCSKHRSAAATGAAAEKCTDPKRPCARLPAWAHWHALRDVAASALIRQGNDVRVVMSILGHTSSEETLRTYARLWPDSQDRARASLDAMWAEDQDPAADG